MKTVHRSPAKGFCNINNYTHFSTSMLFPTPITKAFSYNLSDMQASEFISFKMASSYFGRSYRTFCSKHEVKEIVNCSKFERCHSKKISDFSLDAAANRSMLVYMP